MGYANHAFGVPNVVGLCLLQIMKPKNFSKFLTQWHSRPRIPGPSYSMLFRCESSNCLGFQTLFFVELQNPAVRLEFQQLILQAQSLPTFHVPVGSVIPVVSPEPTYVRTLGSVPVISPPESVPAGWWEASLQPLPWWHGAHSAHAAGSQQLHDWALFWGKWTGNIYHTWSTWGWFYGSYLLRCVSFLHFFFYKHLMFIHDSPRYLVGSYVFIRFKTTNIH